MRNDALVTILAVDVGVDVEVYVCQRPVDLDLSQVRTPRKVRGMNNRCQSDDDGNDDDVRVYYQWDIHQMMILSVYFWYEKKIVAEPIQTL